MCKPNSFTDKNICFRSMFFVKIATMFKLLVILFIIKLYARNDIFKLDYYIHYNRSDYYIKILYKSE